MKIELSSNLKIKIAVILMVLMFFSLWEVSHWTIIFWTFFALFFPIVLFFKPDKWTWCLCIVILLGHIAFIPYGLANYPIRHVCGCPSGPDWESIARGIIAFILCIPALILLLIAGKQMSNSAKGLSYWKALAISIFAAMIVIIPILVIMAIPGTFGRRAPYTYEKNEIQGAVTQYQESHSGALPIIEGANVSINESSYSIIDLCELFYIPDQPAWKNTLPYGVYSAPNPGNDNCDVSDACCGCCTTSHYIWAVDANGSVLSTCVNTDSNGGGCANVSQDGYQGIWP